MNDSSSNSSQKKPWGFLKVLSWWEIGALTYWAFSQLVSQFFSCKTVSREWTYLAGNCIFQQSFVLILGGRRKVFNFFSPPWQKNSLPVCHRPQGGELHDLIGHYLSLLQFLSCHTVCFLTYAKRNNIGMHPFWLWQSLFLLSSLPQILSSYAISSIHFALAHLTP